MKRRLSLTLFLIFFGLTACAKPKPKGPPPVSEEEILKYETIVQQPSGNAPFPFLLIIPGKDAGMENAFFSKLAGEARRRGFFTVRFNWPFLSTGGKPSADLKAEHEVLDKIQRYYLQKKYVDKKRAFVVAKGFGSLLLMKGALANAQGVVLVSPICTEESPFKLAYGALLSTSKPFHILNSVTQPTCPHSQVYGFLMTAKEGTTASFLRGNNFFKLGPTTIDGQQDAALAAAMAFLLTENLREIEKIKEKKEPSAKGKP